jgi:hypothetical protein
VQVCLAATQCSACEYNHCTPPSIRAPFLTLPYCPTLPCLTCLTSQLPYHVLTLAQHCPPCLLHSHTWARPPAWRIAHHTTPTHQLPYSPRSPSPIAPGHRFCLLPRPWHCGCTSHSLQQTHTGCRHHCCLAHCTTSAGTLSECPVQCSTCTTWLYRCPLSLYL